MAGTAFTLHLPVAPGGAAIFSVPHSGRDYPPDMLRQSLLDPLTLRSSEDAFVDLLFADAPACGAPLLVARAPRAWIDVNRGADELDPALIEGVVRVHHSPRVASGLGVVPRVVAGGRAIYPGRIARAEAEARLAAAWHPYHAALRALVEETRARCGEAVVIDCHSMPHDAIESHCRPGQPRPEIVLGDRFGAAAGREVTDRVEAAFAAAGLVVARNAPFAGAFIAQAYGRPARRQHVVQIEIDRALYMDEARVEPRPDFAAFRSLIAGVVAEITGAGGAASRPLAAE